MGVRLSRRHRADQQRRRMSTSSCRNLAKVVVRHPEYAGQPLRRTHADRYRDLPASETQRVRLRHEGGRSPRRQEPRPIAVTRGVNVYGLELPLQQRLRLDRVFNAARGRALPRPSADPLGARFGQRSRGLLPKFPRSARSTSSSSAWKPPPASFPICSSPSTPSISRSRPAGSPPAMPGGCFPPTRYLQILP